MLDRGGHPGVQSGLRTWSSLELGFTDTDSPSTSKSTGHTSFRVFKSILQYFFFNRPIAIKKRRWWVKLGL